MSKLAIFRLHWSPRKALDRPFPGTKLASEFTRILKIVNIIKSYWGKLYYDHSRWARLKKIWMDVKIGNFQAPLFRPKKFWIGILYNLVCKFTLIHKVFVTWADNFLYLYMKGYSNLYMISSFSIYPFLWNDIVKEMGKNLIKSVLPGRCIFYLSLY